MKILVICQYYYPEPFRITDICEELVARGHEVAVITGVPNYPMGNIYEGYRHGEKRDEVVNGVSVHRCFTFGRRSGAIWRFLNYYSYSFSSSRYASKLKNNFDVVFVNQLSPVMMANAGIEYAKKYHKKLVLYCLDLWPESLVAGGIKRDTYIFHYFYKKSKKIYAKADKILITSQMFKTYFNQEFAIPLENLVYLPQYAESIFSSEDCKKECDEYIDLVFAGNIGVVQSVKTIVKAAHKTKDITNLRWHIIGDGSDLENCKALAETLGVKSIIFYGRKPIEDMPNYYKIADAMLVSLQNNPGLSMTLPGKVQTYMSAGKPILGAINGETAAIIRHAHCGECCSAEDDEGLSTIVRKFCGGKKELHIKYGNNARTFYQNHFIKSKNIVKLENELGI